MKLDSGQAWSIIYMASRVAACVSCRVTAGWLKDFFVAGRSEPF